MVGRLREIWQRTRAWRSGGTAGAVGARGGVTAVVIKGGK